MANGYSVDDLLDFLKHAGDRGLMPAASAQAFAVACRNVFGMLNDQERADLRETDLDATIKRFMNKRARDFNPSSLKEYERRARRAVELFRQWREDPASFSMKTRATSNTRKGAVSQRNPLRGIGRVARSVESDESPAPGLRVDVPEPVALEQGGYRSTFPVRPGRLVTISNIPEDLTAAEAERLAQFIRMLTFE